MFSKTDLVIFGGKIATINNEKAKICVDGISLGNNVYRLCSATELKNACIYALKELNLQYKMNGYLTAEQWPLYHFCLNKKNELTAEQWIRGVGIFVDLCSLSAELFNNNNNNNVSNRLPRNRK